MSRHMRVRVVGPPPGSHGGIGTLMKYLEERPISGLDFEFLDSGISGQRARAFLSALRHSYVRKSHRPDLVHINIASKGSTYRKLLLSRLYLVQSIPYVLHLHGAGYKQFYEASSKPMQAAIRTMFRQASAVIVLGTAWRDYIVTELQVPLSQIRVLANAVPGPALKPTRAPSRTVVFVGTLNQRKGILDLLHAVEQLDDIALTIIGDGTDHEINTALSKSYARVRMTGWISPEAIQEELSKAAVFALPSYNEGLPLALLEALASGLPVVATPVGSVPEVFDNGAVGTLVDPGDVDALAKAIDQLASQTPENELIAHLARDVWAENYDINDYPERLGSIYRQVLKCS